jgi:hypothetical protein
MPETKTKRRPAANAANKKAATRKAATRKPRVAQSKPRAATKEHDSGSAAKRTTELSEDVIQSLEDGARSASEAVRKFLETVDGALPLRGEGPSKREEITDSALEMAQRLVHTQSEFLRKVVDSAGKSLSRSDDAK